MTTPSIQLVSAIFANDSFKIKALLEQGVNVNDKSLYGIPPIIRVVLYDKPEALKTFIEFGADKSARDSQGRTALELAQKYNHPKIVEILLQQGGFYI